MNTGNEINLSYALQSKVLPGWTTAPKERCPSKYGILTAKFHLLGEHTKSRQSAAFATQGAHQRESGAQNGRCVFHVQFPPERQLHFSGLRRTFFRICQVFLPVFLIYPVCF